MDTKEPTQNPSILPESNEETAQLTPERIDEFTASLGEDAKWGAEVEFLDSINTVDELEQIQKYIKENNIDFNTNLLDWYRQNLERWNDPEKQLSTWIREDYPLTSDKLDTPQKIRIFLRFADFCGVAPFQIARVTEGIIHQHETEGKDYVEISDSSFFEPNIPERLAYFTQLQAWTAQRLLFPGCKRSGSAENLYFDWREQEGEK